MGMKRPLSNEMLGVHDCGSTIPRGRDIVYQGNKEYQFHIKKRLFSTNQIQKRV